MRSVSPPRAPGGVGDGRGGRGGAEVRARVVGDDERGAEDPDARRELLVDVQPVGVRAFLRELDVVDAEALEHARQGRQARERAGPVARVGRVGAGGEVGEAVVARDRAVVREAVQQAVDVHAQERRQAALEGVEAAEAVRVDLAQEGDELPEVVDAEQERAAAADLRRLRAGGEGRSFSLMRAASVWSDEREREAGAALLQHRRAVRERAPPARVADAGQARATTTRFGSKTVRTSAVVGRPARRRSKSCGVGCACGVAAVSSARRTVGWSEPARSVSPLIATTAPCGPATASRRDSCRSSSGGGRARGARRGPSPPSRAARGRCAGRAARRPPRCRAAARFVGGERAAGDARDERAEDEARAGRSGVDADERGRRARRVGERLGACVARRRGGRVVLAAVAREDDREGRESDHRDDHEAAIRRPRRER